LEILHHLGALNNEFKISKLGQQLLVFPLEPQMSKVLVSSFDLNCDREVITIISMLQIQYIFYRPIENKELATIRLVIFDQPEGDHLTMLYIFKSWIEKDFSPSWCMENFIQARALKTVNDIVLQIILLIERTGVIIETFNCEFMNILKSFTCGYFMNTAKKTTDISYITFNNNFILSVHPTSSLFNQQPEWIIYQYSIYCIKDYMKNLISIDPVWLPYFASNFCLCIPFNCYIIIKHIFSLEQLYDRRYEILNWRLSKRRG